MIALRNICYEGFAVLFGLRAVSMLMGEARMGRYAGFASHEEASLYMRHTDRPGYNKEKTDGADHI